MRWRLINAYMRISDLIQVGGVKGGKGRLTLTWIEVGKTYIKQGVDRDKDHDFGYDE